METKLLILAFMATISLSVAVSSFVSTNPFSTLPKTVCSPAIKGDRTLVMRGKCYYAFSVCDNGHVLLLPNVRSPVVPYDTVKDFYYLRGLPIIAAFWSKMTTDGKVQYAQTRDGNVKNAVKNILRPYGINNFNPFMVIWVRYPNMKPLNGNGRNDFQILLSADVRGHTFAIFIYHKMEWNRYCSSCPTPMMGFTNGKGYGYHYRVPNIAQCLRYTTKVFKISDAYPKLSKPKTVISQKYIARLDEALRNVQNSNIEQKNEMYLSQDDDGEYPIADDDNSLAFESQEDDYDGGMSKEYAARDEYKY